MPWQAQCSLDTDNYQITQIFAVSSAFCATSGSSRKVGLVHCYYYALVSSSQQFHSTKGKPYSLFLFVLKFCTLCLQFHNCGTSPSMHWHCWNGTSPVKNTVLFYVVSFTMFDAPLDKQWKPGKLPQNGLYWPLLNHFIAVSGKSTVQKINGHASLQVEYSSWCPNTEMW